MLIAFSHLWYQVSSHVCAADTVASRLLSKKLRACWFSAAWLVCRSSFLAGCLQCSEFSEPVWAAPAGGSGNWSLRFPQRVWFHFSLLSNNCLSVRITSSPADDECPADQIFSVSLLDLQVCLCYTDVFALTFHQFLPRTTSIIQRINCVALFFRLTQV